MEGLKDTHGHKHGFFKKKIKDIFSRPNSDKNLGF